MENKKLDGRTLNAVCITGTQANSKSTLAKKLEKLFCSKLNGSCILRVDASEIIKWGLALPGPLSQEIKEYEQIMSRGHYLPDDVMIPLFVSWLEHQCAARPRFRILILSGFPRTRKQRELLVQMFNRIVMVNIKIKKQRSWALVKFRLNQTPPEQRRLDDAGGKEVFETRQVEFENHTAPMIDAANGSILHVDWEDPLSTRIEIVLRHMKSLGPKSPVKQRLIRKAMGRMKDPEHPAYAAIKSIEALPKPQMEPEEEMATA